MIMSLFLLFLFFIKFTFSVVIDHVQEPPGWIEIGRTKPETPIQLIFAVKQQNVDILEELLLAKSDPDNDEYGNWMTWDEINTLVAPTEDSLNAIEKWLAANDFDISMIVAETPNSDFISINTTTDKAEKLLKCEYYDYVSAKNKDIIVSVVRVGTDYEVDASVAPHLDFVSPTKRFPMQSTLTVKAQGQRVGAGDVTPTFLHSLYNTGSTTGKSSSNSMGILSMIQQYYNMNDLEQFWNTYSIPSCTVYNYPANQSSGYGDEAELDTQYITAMGEKIPFQVWYFGGNDPLLSWILSVESISSSPWIFSVSYGGDEPSYGAYYEQRLNTEFAKVTSTGRTIFVSAGDSGAGGGCAYSGVFVPEFPTCAPYITSVGGVTGGTIGKSPVGETVWVSGGGGFSNVFARQSWQSSAVSKFLSTSTKLPSSKYYNSSGRGYPDVSAQSVDFIIIIEGQENLVDGTSCSSPTVAGIFALLNDLRLQNKMSTLGFVNPWIYSTASKYSTAFNDCTSGYNAGCSSQVLGFYAITGWDAASGYGSPNYSLLSKYVLTMGEKTKKYGARFQREEDDD